MFMDYSVRYWCMDEVGPKINANHVDNNTHFSIELIVCNGLQLDRITLSSIVVDLAFAPIHLY